jgi:hypothetical protein
LRDPGDSGGGNSSNSDQPRQPAGASESKGGQFAPKNGAESGSSSGEFAPEASSSPADGDSGASESSSTETPSPRNYPDNLNKPASEQTDYSPPERSIDPPVRQSRKAAWEKTLQGVSEMITEKKESAKAEKKQAKEFEQAISFNPAELEAESSQMIDDFEDIGEAPKQYDFESQKEYEAALEKHNRAKGAQQATIKKRAAAQVLPTIAEKNDLSHAELEQAVNEEIAMSLPYHKQREAARKYLTTKADGGKSGWSAGRVNRIEDSGGDSDKSKFDEIASEWAGMFPEIAGSDESEWVAKMWDLIKEGPQDPPSAGDEDFVSRVANRLVESRANSSFPADSDSESDSDFEPYTYNPEDPESTPFSRSAVVGLIVDKYMRQFGLC